MRPARRCIRNRSTKALGITRRRRSTTSRSINDHTAITEATTNAAVNSRPIASAIPSGSVGMPPGPLSLAAVLTAVSPEIGAPGCKGSWAIPRQAARTAANSTAIKMMRGFKAGRWCGFMFEIARSSTTADRVNLDFSRQINHSHRSLPQLGHWKISIDLNL